MPTKDELINNFIMEFSNAKSHIKELNEKYSYDNFNSRPAENKWSAGDCLEHLNTINNLYLNNTYKVLEKTKKSDAQNKNYKPRFLSQIFISLMKPESKLKFKAPGKLKKMYKGDLDETVKIFMKTQDDFIELAENVHSYDLRIKVPSPVTNLIKFQLGEMFMVIIEHQKRHLAQAERALETANEN